MSELISIYLPTKNRCSTLQKAVASVLRQTYTNYELIIVDDASTDGTWGYLQSIQNEKIRIFRNDSSKGAPYCRNLAIKSAKGRFVTGLDDDDEFLPKRLEALLDAYDERYAFVFSDYYIQRGSRRYVKKIWRKPYISLEELYRNGNVIGNQVFTTKEKFIKAGLFDVTLKAAQDYDMWLRLVGQYNSAYHLNMPLQIVYISKSSITHSSNKIKGYRKFYLKHKNSMDLQAKKYHTASYLINKKYDFPTFIRFVPINYKGAALFVKYLKGILNERF